MVSVVQHATVSNDQSITYTIVAGNHGKGVAKDATIRLPFNQHDFSRESAWVSQITDDTIELKTGRLGSHNDVVTATVRLMPVPGAPVAELNGQRLTFTWSDAAGGGAGQSNQYMPSSPNDPSLYSLSVRVTDQSAGIYHMSANVFIPGESIGLWYHTSDGKDIPIEQPVSADENGYIDIEVTLKDLPSGSYILVASGAWSQITASGTLQVS